MFSSLCAAWSNSNNRRIDLIAEDLALDNKYEESQKKRKAQKRTARPKRKKPNADINYHYIAYVPMGGQVWELDGLQTNPLSLGIATPLSHFTEKCLTYITRRSHPEV